MKKNQQLAKRVDQVHEAWARANGYRDNHHAPSSWSHKQQASSVKHKGSSAKPQASSSLIIDPGKSFTDL